MSDPHAETNRAHERIDGVITEQHKTDLQLQEVSLLMGQQTENVDKLEGTVTALAAAAAPVITRCNAKAEKEEQQDRWWQSLKLKVIVGVLVGIIVVGGVPLLIWFGRVVLNELRSTRIQVEKSNGAAIHNEVPE